MADLRTDYKDDLLDTSVNTQRKYRMVNNADGTISLEDETVYTQNGDTFGSAEVNQIHAAVNMVNESLTADNGTNFRFGYNSETEEYGYIVTDSEGADTLVPFSSKIKLSYVVSTVSTDSTYATVGITTNAFKSGKQLFSIFGAKYFRVGGNTYTPALELSYSGGWILTARDTVVYNGVTYTAGQRIRSWSYDTTVSLTITCNTEY